MPIREYECDACGRRFEKLQKSSDPPIEVCPTCGGHVHKMISSPAFQFKGTGWYVTDYAKKESGGGKGGSESGDTTAAKETTSSETNKGEKKSDSTSSSTSETSSSTPKTPGKDS